MQQAEELELFVVSGQARKKEPKPKLFGPDIFRRGGGLPREGVGAKRFGMSFESRDPGKQNFLAGYSGIFARTSGIFAEMFEKKTYAFNFWPLLFEASGGSFRIVCNGAEEH